MKFFGYEVINGFRSHRPKGFYDPKKGHTGIDIDTPVNTEITLPIQVEMVDLLNQKEMGLTMYVRDQEGNVLVFAHLSSTNGPVGRVFKPGEVLCKTGNSGKATTGPHLHFEIISPLPEAPYNDMTRVLGKFSGFNIDPERYLQKVYRESTDGLQWLKTHEIIFGDHLPSDPVTYGEFELMAKRLASKIQEWTLNKLKNENL